MIPMKMQTFLDFSWYWLTAKKLAILNIMYSESFPVHLGKVKALSPFFCGKEGLCKI